MRNLATAMIIASAVWIGCTDDDIDRRGPAVNPPDIGSDLEPGQLELTATILGLPPYAFISGIGHARVDPTGQAFTAEIEIRGDTPGAVRAWHVHVGTCAATGAIVGAPESYRPLMIDNDGTDARSILVVGTLDPNGTYSINVHRAPDDLATIIACGDLVH